MEEQEILEGKQTYLDQIVLLEMKNIIIEITKSKNVLSSKLDPGKERISELEERAEEIFQNRARREKEKLRKKLRYPDMSN